MGGHLGEAFLDAQTSQSLASLTARATPYIALRPTRPYIYAIRLAVMALIARFAGSLAPLISERSNRWSACRGSGTTLLDHDPARENERPDHDQWHRKILQLS
jgi:hypothetical protein